MFINRHHTEESRKKISEANIGYKHTKEAKRKISNANRGKVLSEETKQKISMSKAGVHLSEEHRQKLSILTSGENNPFYGKRHTLEFKQAMKGNRRGWKGGYSNVPLYNTYIFKLEPYEQCRKNEQDPNVLEVKCTYCGKWHISTVTNIKNRIAGINANDKHKLYCSSECKQECPIYHQQKHYKGQENCNSREVQPELRQLVFERDNWTCQRCGSTCSLHCHHIEPVKLNPIESADIDVCITFCVDCHKWSHMEIPGCGYWELAQCVQL